MERELTVTDFRGFAYHIAQAQKLVIRYSQTREGAGELTPEQYLCLADILTDIKAYFIDKGELSDMELFCL